MTKRLYRSRNDKMVAGVCGGLGKYFDIDPTLVRIVMVVLLFSGVGFLAYILAAIIIPEEPYDYEDDDDEDVEIFDKDGKKVKMHDESRAEKTRKILGYVFIAIGALTLFDMFFVHIQPGMIVGLALLGLGAYILIGKTAGRE